MTLGFWWRLHTLGWMGWLPATARFASFLVWAWPVQKRQMFVPWTMLLIVVVSVVARSYLTSWHQVFWSDRDIWGAGILAMSVTAALPLAVCFGLASTVMRRIATPLGRTFAVIVPALAVRIVLGAYLSHWIQRGLLD